MTGQPLQQLLQAGLQAVQGSTLISSYSVVRDQCWEYRHAGVAFTLTLPRKPGKLFVVGAGKAAAAMAAGLEAVLGEAIDDGLIIVKDGHCTDLQHIAQREASHPVPDARGIAATAALLDLLQGLAADDQVIVLLSGGASALLCAPAPGISLGDKIALTDALLRSGADIHAMNTVRRAISRIKGGGLLAAAAPAAVLTLCISDVPGDEPAVIGSGPTIATTTTAADALVVLQEMGLIATCPRAIRAYLQDRATTPSRVATMRNRAAAWYCLANNAALLGAIAASARARGHGVHHAPALTGHTHHAAGRFCQALLTLQQQAFATGKPQVLLAGGETTLAVRGTGLGGRNQEFALVAANALAGIAGVSLLAAGTDGTDGPTPAAGAFVDGSTLARARAAGLDYHAFLRCNDSYHFFAALDDLLITGPTGTNVMDVALGLVQPPP